MVAFYDSKPSKLEAVGNGSHIYRWNIQEVEQPATQEGEEVQKKWRCEEVTVWVPLSSNKITEAVITTKWDANYEQKLVNEYNAAKLGLYGTTTSEEAKLRVQAYKDYLTERVSLKTQVDNDCAELGIL